MYWSQPRANIALMLRWLRNRFGVSAPHVIVRAHVPWYLRVGVAAFLIGLTVVATSWVYDTGRRLAGYDRSTAEAELQVMRDKTEKLQAELERLRGVGSASESSLQIERTAQLRLSEQVKKIETENGRLREDLAAFENIASGDAKSEAIGIHRFQVERDPSSIGGYRYRLLLSAPVLHTDREFNGTLQLLMTVQQDGKAVIVNAVATDPADPKKYQIRFKYFRRVEGSFNVPVNAVLTKLEVRLMQGSNIVASQQTTF